MKIAVFGDLEHVRSFGAQLTSACLKSDLFHCAPYDADIKFFPMPNIGKNNNWKKDLANFALSDRIKKKLRDSRAEKSDVAQIKGTSNVHYDSPLDVGTPNSLEDFQALEAATFREGAHIDALRKMVDWADVVYINGEGNIVNHTVKNEPRYRVGARILLSVAAICVAKNVPFQLINCTIDPRHNEFESVLRHYLPQAQFVAVREPLSFRFSQKSLGLTNVRQGVDASLGYVSEAARFVSPSGRTKPHIVIGDSSGLRGTGKEVEEAYRKLFQFYLNQDWTVAFFDGTSVYSHVLGKLANSMGIEWLSDHYLDYKTLQAELAKATVMFSGRWHPSIQALSCGVPVVLFGADSCKTEGLSEQMNVKFLRGSLGDIAASEDLLFEITEFGLSEPRRAILERASQQSALRVNNFIDP